MRAIFISYRRSDSQGEAGRLFHDLVTQFGEDKVFMDVSAIDAGSDFRKAIEESVAGCGVLLAIIGPEWVNATDAQGAGRLDDTMDFVRLEISYALRRDIPVVPVLVRGARMPRRDQLPEDLADLIYRHGLELTHPRWRSDVQLLIKALRPLVGDVAQPAAGETASLSGETRMPGAPAPAQRMAGVTSLPIDPVTVQRIARELAVHIGPIAEIVVKRAAAHCGSATELCREVSAEIDSRSEREKFLAAMLR